MNNQIQNTSQKPGELIRAFRGKALSLNKLADMLHDEGCERPSTAKLSRIENGLQPVTQDILLALSRITGIAPKKLRPDLAELMKQPAKVA